MKPVTAHVFINPGVHDIDNSKWYWYYDMSLLETMEFACGEYIKIKFEEEWPNVITILGREISGEFLPITYHTAIELND